MATAATGRMPAPLSLSLVILLALPVGAAAQAPEPGVWWESTVQMEMPGFSMPARAMRVCLPKKGLSQPPTALDQGGECRVEHFKRSGNKMTWKLRCEGEQPMSGEGEMVHTATSYDGRVTMRTPDGEMPMTMKGRLVGGDCDAAAPRREAAARQKEFEALQAQSQVQQAALCDSLVEQMNVAALDAQSALCGDTKHKARLCERLASRDGYEAVSAQGEAALQQAGTMCRRDMSALRSSLCSRAARDASAARPDTKALKFVGERCPVESKAIAQKQCAGRSYTGLEGGYSDFCTQYAQELLGRGVQPAGGKAPARTLEEEAVERGKEALKGLLPF